MPPTPTTLTPPPPRTLRRSGLTDSIGHPATVRVPAVPPPPPPPDVNETPSPRSMASRVGGAYGQSPTLPLSTMPRVGDVFEGFQLVEELGHGSFARVYRAKQQSLAGRDVALKITLRATREPERLARLQHTNIVPVYSVHNCPSVQVICMPFLGRQTIADKILGHRKSHYSGRLSTKKAAATRRGSTSLAGSASSMTAPAAAPATPVPVTRRPATAGDIIGDVEAVLEILVQLADGLDHAHQRGILHLDLKPANVLLADSGEPMLLDFNLSFDMTDPTRELVGGTIPYMAPEQLLDLRSRGRGGVDVRTDLYSLGVLAYEMLSGTSPFPISGQNLADYDRLIETRRKGPGSLRAVNPDVSPAVESIIRKLLAPEPADRYQSAAELREDLQRQLSDRPLRYAADRSIPERLGKWRRRNPRTLVALCLAMLLALSGATGGLAYYQSEGRATAEAEQRARKAHEVLEQTRLDLALGEQLLGSDSSVSARGRVQVLAILKQYGLPHDANWQNSPNFRRLPQNDRSRVAGDLGELLLLLAHSKWIEVRQAEGEVKRLAAMESLGLNHAAESCFGGAPPPFLMNQRAEITAFLGGTPETEIAAGKPVTARDHFLEGVALINGRNFKSATKRFRETVSLEPNHGAAQFCLALCLHHRGEYSSAAERYETAGALMPDDPRPYCFAGQSYGRNGKFVEAEAAFNRSLLIDADQAEVYYSRAKAKFDLRNFAEAERDATEALSREGPALQIYFLRARIREAKADFTGAAADRQAAAGHEPRTAMDYVIRGWSRLPKHPNEALADFRAASRLDPESAQSLRHQIYVLSDLLGENEEGLKVATRALELYPEDAAVRAHKALIHARLGDRTSALKEIEKLGHGQKDPGILFQLGRTYALTSQVHPGDRGKAISLLNSAFLGGFRQISNYESCKELEPLRKTAEFEAFLVRIRGMLI